MSNKSSYRSRPVHEPSVYLQLSDEFGLKLYTYLHHRISDKRGVSRVYEKVMHVFYQTMATQPDLPDAERTLYAIADRICSDGLFDHPGAYIPEETPEDKPSKGFWICLILLILLNLAGIWLILGLLMEMGFLPLYDLGYSWFHSNIIPFFQFQS